MGADDDAGCVEHVWRLTGVHLQRGGSQSEYSCERCGTTLLVGPGQDRPQTV